MVEFALVIVPLMLLLLGAVQFGVIWATQIGVTNAVRDSVRAASLVQPKASGDPNGTVDTTTEKAYAGEILSGVLEPALRNNIPFYNDASANPRQVCYESVQATLEDGTNTTILRAKVSVTYAHPIFIPLIAGVLGQSALSTTATLSVPVGLDKPFSIPAAGVSECAP